MNVRFLSISRKLSNLNTFSSRGKKNILIKFDLDFFTKAETNFLSYVEKDFFVNCLLNIFFFY